VLSDAVAAQGGVGLDPLWVKPPIGGSELSTCVTLLGANKLNVAVFIDSSSKEEQAAKRLRDNDQLAANGLVEISEFTGLGESDIEDLFEPGFYLDLVNRAYKKDLPKALRLGDLDGAGSRPSAWTAPWFWRDVVVSSGARIVVLVGGSAGRAAVSGCRTPCAGVLFRTRYVPTTRSSERVWT